MENCLKQWWPKLYLQITFDILFVCLFICNEVCYPLMSRGDRRQRVNIWYSVRTTACRLPLKTFPIPPPGSSDFSTPASLQTVMSLRCIFSRLGLFPFYLRRPWVIYSPVIYLILFKVSYIETCMVGLRLYM